MPGGETILPGIIDCHVHSTYRDRNLGRHLLHTPTYNILRSTVRIFPFYRMVSAVC